MASARSGMALGQIQRLFDEGTFTGLTDAQLVERFLDRRDEGAFAALVARHGPMVLAVCRGVLRAQSDAEDAFQATFLVLVKKAGGLRDCNLLSNWLYGVALRIANKEKAKGARRRIVERQATERALEAVGDIDQAELRSVIDEEIRRLPERYRVPLVLCHLEGLRHDEVAKRLGCPVGTVESRLSRAREQLRDRLTRRGLAPTASALAAMLKPPVASAVFPPLVEATLRVALEQPSRQSTVGTIIASLGCLVERMSALLPALHARAVMSTLVLCASVAVVGFGVYQANGEPERRPEPPPATRDPSAVAYALSGITIDGRLDDWPKDLRVYPIRNQLVTNSSYIVEERDPSQGSDAYFMVGYDREAELIYLAVVVPDKDVIAKPGSAMGTDAVEVYIDGTFSNRTIEDPSKDWNLALDAATMPVLQYAAVPGQVAAYGDPWNGNPSLLYAHKRQTSTKMKYRHADHVTTYEWAIKAYDRYPDLPTRLHSGKRLGFEVAVVDKDDPKVRPYFLTWGEPPVVFKGFDAGSLGELILVDQP
jgi:RNA polymerase sigma factor (sigma-70 family)